MHDHKEHLLPKNMSDFYVYLRWTNLCKPKNVSADGHKLRDVKLPFQPTSKAPHHAKMETYIENGSEGLWRDTCRFTIPLSLVA